MKHLFERIYERYFEWLIAFIDDDGFKHSYNILAGEYSIYFATGIEYDKVAYKYNNSFKQHQILNKNVIEYLLVNNIGVIDNTNQNKTWTKLLLNSNIVSELMKTDLYNLKS
jgi:hypothetical protein